MRILRLSVIAGVLGTALAGCSSSGSEPAPGPPGSVEARSQKQRITAPQVDPADLQAQVQGDNAFAVDLYKQLCGEPGNVFFSPHSMSLALAMLEAGARGDTATQIDDALHYELPQDRLHPAFNKLDLELASRGAGAEGADGGKFRLNIVNAVWGQQGYRFEADYLDVLALNYGAGLRLMDFASKPDDCRQQINTWVEDQTEERIKDLLPEGVIDGATTLVLTNAIYFNAAWAKAFEKSATRDGPFMLPDGGDVTVPMMSGSLRASYGTADGLQVVALPYDGDELSMLIVLPDEGQLDAVEQSLTGQRLQDIIHRMTDAQVLLTMPRFEFEQAIDLKPPLMALGMKNAFEGGAADLSGIDGTRALYVAAALHKAFIKVNEAGTEAAAATAVVVGRASAPEDPITVKVDRPFLFAIRDHATGAILFLGRVVNPQS